LPRVREELDRETQGNDQSLVSRQEGIAMKKFNTIECVTDFPDGQIEEDDRIIRPGGRAAAFAIASMLREYGMITITTVPQLDYENGWQFEAAHGEQTGARGGHEPAKRTASRSRDPARQEVEFPASATHGQQ